MVEYVEIEGGDRNWLKWVRGREEQLSVEETNSNHEEVGQQNFRLLVIANLLFFIAMLVASLRNNLYQLMFGSIIMILICVTIFRGGRIAKWIYIGISLSYSAILVYVLATGFVLLTDMALVLNMVTIAMFVVTVSTSVLFIFTEILRNMAENKLKIVISLFAVSLIIGTIVYTFPRHYAFTSNGLMYQLGEENREFGKYIAININGKLKRSIDGTRTFEGVIDIDDEMIPIPKDGRNLKLTFDQFGQAMLTYSYVGSGRSEMFSYGGIFINHNFSKFTIWKYDIQVISPNERKGSWSAGNGYMISAPAQTRDDALRISNELMSDYLRDYILE